MIEPTFLADLRRQYNPQDLLLLVQLEQLAPAWWPDQDEMAEQLGTIRSTLCRSLKRLEARGLIRRYCSKGGTHVWWVRRSADEQPDEGAAPAWRLHDLHRRRCVRVVLGREREWCERWEIPFRTLQSLLYGRMKVLRGRWELAGNPWDCEDA